MVTLDTWALVASNVAVGVGTIVLAFVAFKQMRESRRQALQQVRVLSDQTAVLRSEQDPLLKSHTFIFKGNQLALNLENRGSGRARKIGIETWFYPTVFEPSQKVGSLVEVSEAGKKEMKIHGRFLQKSTAQLKYQQSHDGESRSYVNFLASTVSGDSLLDHGITENFTLRHVEPVFEMALNKKGGNTSLAYPKFEELKRIIQDNGFQFVSIWLRLVCKDSVDRPVYGQSWRFVADVTSQHTRRSNAGRTPTKLLRHRRA